MTTNIYGTAAAILRIVSQTSDNDAVASDVQRGLSKGQLAAFEPALSLLVAQGDVEVYTATDNRPGRKPRRIRATHPIKPEPHCSTCTCYDVL